MYRVLREVRAPATPSGGCVTAWPSTGWGIVDTRTGRLHVPRTLWPSEAEACEERAALLAPYPPESAWHSRLAVRHMTKRYKKR